MIINILKIIINESTDDSSSSIHLTIKQFIVKITLYKLTIVILFKKTLIAYLHEFKDLWISIFLLNRSLPYATLTSI